MQADLHHFLVPPHRDVLLALAPVVFTAFVSMPLSLSRHPGELRPGGRTRATHDLRHPAAIQRVRRPKSHLTASNQTSAPRQSAAPISSSGCRRCGEQEAGRPTAGTHSTSASSTQVARRDPAKGGIPGARANRGAVSSVRLTWISARLLTTSTREGQRARRLVGARCRPRDQVGTSTMPNSPQPCNRPRNSTCASNSRASRSPRRRPHRVGLQRLGLEHHRAGRVDDQLQEQDVHRHQQHRPAQQHRHDRQADDRHVHRDHEGDGLAQVGEHAAPVAHGRHDRREVVVQQHQGGGLARHVGAARAHGHADVRRPSAPARR